MDRMTSVPSRYEVVGCEIAERGVIEEGGEESLQCDFANEYLGFINFNQYNQFNQY